MKTAKNYLLVRAGWNDGRALAGLARGVWQRIKRWRRLAYERRLLASLDSRMLRDVGISRAEARRESARPFWDDRPMLSDRDD